MNEFGTLRLEVDIPRQKIMAASMMLAEQYKPLVEEALQEAIREINSDNGEIKAAIKEEIKSKIDDAIRREINDAVSAIIRKSEWGFYGVAKKAVDELLKSK